MALDHDELRDLSALASRPDDDALRGWARRRLRAELRAAGEPDPYPDDPDPIPPRPRFWKFARPPAHAPRGG